MPLCSLLRCTSLRFFWLVAALVVTSFSLMPTAQAKDYVNTIKEIGDWRIIGEDQSGARISRVYDEELETWVTQLEGDFRAHGFIVGSRWYDRGWKNWGEEKFLWQMKASEKFVVAVYVDTERGARRITYSHRSDNGLVERRDELFSIDYGLGDGIMDGKWHSLSRNLAVDLERGEPGNKLRSVSGVQFRGNLMVDAVSLEKSDSTSNPIPVSATPAVPEQPDTDTDAEPTKPVTQPVVSKPEEADPKPITAPPTPGTPTMDPKPDTDPDPDTKPPLVAPPPPEGAPDPGIKPEPDTKPPISAPLPPGGVPDPDADAQPPKAVITANVTSGGAPLAVNFDAAASIAQGDATIASYAWVLGNGDESDQATASTTYAESGNYTVTLTVTDSKGLSASASTVIQVTEKSDPDTKPPISAPPPPGGDKPDTDPAAQAPEAVLSASVKSGEAPLEVNFDATDSKAQGTATIAEYKWDFGNDASSDQAAASTTYTESGSYTVTLTVTDSAGLSASATTVIEVAEKSDPDTKPPISAPPAPGGDKPDQDPDPAAQPPEAVLSANVESGEAPLEVNFDATGSKAKGGATIAEYKWDFGNGSSSDQATAATTYTESGSYTATLTITDSAGLSDTETTVIEVAAKADPDPKPTISAPPPPGGTPSAALPEVVLTASAESGVAPLEVNFDASASKAQGSATIAEIAWDFGNGNVSDQAKASTTYTESGSYNVKLTVTDSAGKSATAQTVIEVTAVTAAAQSRGVSDSAGLGQCHVGLTTAESVSVPQLDKPAFMESYLDPAFGAKVTRITDGKFGEVRKPTYSTMQAWNADESLLLLYRAGQGGGYHFLLDGQNYELVADLEILPTDIEEVYWSYNDPDTLFYVSRGPADYGEFKRYSVSAGISSTITDFREVCGDGLPVGGEDVFMQSADDDLFGFRCVDDNDKSHMLSYRISTDELLSEEIGAGTPWESNTAPMPGLSGDRFWYQGAVLDSDLNYVERRLDMGNVSEHADIGLTSDGQDALYQTAFNASPEGCNGDADGGVGHLVEHNMETGACRTIISQSQGYPYTTSATHLSANSYKNPGWVALSSVGKSEQLTHLTDGQPAPALFSEIYLASTDPSNPVTCRLAHHRSHAKLAENGGYESYFGEPHVNISPSGTRILFGSDWNDSGSVDTYVIELPGFTRR